eukprot:Rhum_TRINITY_DN14480_c8_g1::Rhum_TRINITY_DN14480_c8_g1_i1::g.92789::m.92789
MDDECVNFVVDGVSLKSLLEQRRCVRPRSSSPPPPSSRLNREKTRGGLASFSRPPASSLLPLISVVQRPPLHPRPILYFLSRRAFSVWSQLRCHLSSQQKQKQRKRKKKKQTIRSTKTQNCYYLLSYYLPLFYISCLISVPDYCFKASSPPIFLPPLIDAAKYNTHRVSKHTHTHTPPLLPPCAAVSSSAFRNTVGKKKTCSSQLSHQHSHPLPHTKGTLPKLFDPLSPPPPPPPLVSWVLDSYAAIVLNSDRSPFLLTPTHPPTHPSHLLAVTFADLLFPTATPHPRLSSPQFPRYPPPVSPLPLLLLSGRTHSVQEQSQLKYPKKQQITNRLEFSHRSPPPPPVSPFVPPLPPPFAKSNCCAKVGGSLPLHPPAHLPQTDPLLTVLMPKPHSCHENAINKVRERVRCLVSSTPPPPPLTPQLYPAHLSLFSSFFAALAV